MSGLPSMPGAGVRARLEKVAASARTHERNHEPAAAQADWQAALELLPADSSQAAWVRSHLAELARDVAEPGRSDAPAWTRKLGPLAPVAVLLLKGKFFLSLLKLPFLLSFAAFAALYWGLYGVRFGIGIAVLVLVHELGHFIEVRRRGLAADLPMFVPGFGAYVRWTAADVTQVARALVIDGVDGDCLAQACLFAAFAEFVATYGEEAAAEFAEGLALRIRKLEFSLPVARHSHLGASFRALHVAMIA